MFAKFAEHGRMTGGEDMEVESLKGDVDAAEDVSGVKTAVRIAGGWDGGRFGNGREVRSRIGKRVAKDFVATRGRAERAAERLLLEARARIVAAVRVAGDTIVQALAAGSTADGLPGLRAAKNAVEGALSKSRGDGWEAMRAFQWQMVDAADGMRPEEMRRIQATQRRAWRVRVADRVRGGEDGLFSLLRLAAVSSGAVAKLLLRSAPVAQLGVQALGEGVSKSAINSASPARPELPTSVPTLIVPPRKVSRRSSKQRGRSRARHDKSLTSQRSDILDAHTSVTESDDGSTLRAATAVPCQRAPLILPSGGGDVAHHTVAENALTRSESTKHTQYKTTEVLVPKSKSGTGLQSFVLGAAMVGVGSFASAAMGVTVSSAVTCTALVATAVAVTEARKPLASSLSATVTVQMFRQSRTVQKIDEMLATASSAFARDRVLPSQRMGASVARRPRHRSKNSLPDEPKTTQALRQEPEGGTATSSSSKLHFAVQSKGAHTQKDAVGSSRRETIDAVAYSVAEPTPAVLATPLLGVLLRALDATAFAAEKTWARVVRRLRTAGVQRSAGRWRMLGTLGRQDSD